MKELVCYQMQIQGVVEGVLCPHVHPGQSRRRSLRIGCHFRGHDDPVEMAIFRSHLRIDPGVYHIDDGAIEVRQSDGEHGFIFERD